MLRGTGRLAKVTVLRAMPGPAPQKVSVASDSVYNQSKV